jgi:hypothetical protein
LGGSPLIKNSIFIIIFLSKKTYFSLTLKNVIYYFKVKKRKINFLGKINFY